MTEKESRDLSRIRHGDFSPFQGEIFDLLLDNGDALSLRLTQVDAPQAADGQPPRERPFALLFTGPPDPGLSQRIYRLENAGFGALELFLVPVGKNDDGYLYEALFN